MQFDKYYDTIRQNHNCLKNSIIHCKDYKDFLTDLENLNILDNESFMFIDPPYINTYNYLLRDDSEIVSLYEYLSNYIELTKCKVMILTEDGDIVRSLFHNKIIKSYNKKYTLLRYTMRIYKDTISFFIVSLYMDFSNLVCSYISLFCSFSISEIFNIWGSFHKYFLYLFL